MDEPAEYQLLVYQFPLETFLSELRKTTNISYFHFNKKTKILYRNKIYSGKKKIQKKKKHLFLTVYMSKMNAMREKKECAIVLSIEVE